MHGLLNNIDYIMQETFLDSARSSSNWILMSCQPHRVTSGQIRLQAGGIIITQDRHVRRKDATNHYKWKYSLKAFRFNPFTARPACKISGLKSAHIHACEQYTRWSYNKCTFNTVRFDGNAFRCSCEGGKKPQLFQIWLCYWSFSE